METVNDSLFLHINVVRAYLIFRTEVGEFKTKLKRKYAIKIVKDIELVKKCFVKLKAVFTADHR